MPKGSHTKKCGKTVKLFPSMRFLDSYQFVSQSLDNLAKTLKTGDFFLLKEFFSNIPDQLFCKLTQKSFLPYSFLDSFAKIEEPLPAFSDSWKNSLTSKVDITFQDYQHALDIYRKFGCTNLGDYNDVYLKTDVLLLTDKFEKFRSVCLSVYQLDPGHFYSAPNLSWESKVISTRVNLGLSQDVIMLLFFERGIRGDINGVGESRQFTANNPHISTFDPSQKTTFGAFRCKMQKIMPGGDYRWNSEITVQTNFGNSRTF